MGQPARKGQKENYAIATAGFAWEWVTELEGFWFVIPDMWGVTLFFEGWLIHLSTQYDCKIAFYNKNAKYRIYFCLLFFPHFEVNFGKCFHEWRENLWIFLGGDIILSSVGVFYFVSPWYQFCLMELTQLLTRNYARESFHFISWWKQNPVSCLPPKTMDTEFHRVWLVCT